MSNRKKPTKRNWEWLLGLTERTFSAFIPLGVWTRYYRRVGASPEVIAWSFDRSDYEETQCVTLVAEVQSHSRYSVLDHWLELFKARITNGDDLFLMRHAMAEKQFEVVPSTLDYGEMLQSTATDSQYILLERGLYLLQKPKPYIIPLEPYPGQPDHHFRLPDALLDDDVPLDFFKPAEQARINAYLESDYCLCQLCQGERAQLGII